MTPTTNTSLINTNLITALGTIIGYIGAEAVTDDLFSRLLWPQRFYNHVSWRNILPLALFLPLGGPLHKAALKAIDTFYHNGLFKGSELGHMLGTAFFQDSSLEYIAHTPESAWEKDHVRNGLWVGAINEMRVLRPERAGGHKQEDGVVSKKRVRQRMTVSHLTLSYPGPQDKTTCVVKDDTGAATLHTYAALILTETTGIATAVFAMVIWKSYFMIIWLLPLFLKLLSAAFTIERESLLIPNRPHETGWGNRGSTTKKFEILQSGQGFQIIEGDEALVLQFFRYYGHPIRSRAREVLQITIVIAFGCVFLTGLLCSILWMPVGLQCLWLGYQIYCTLALYVLRYSQGNTCATTKETIAEKFSEMEAMDSGDSLLFGERKSGMLKAKLVRTFHDSYAEGKAHVDRLLQGDVHSQPSRMDSDSSICSTSSMDPLIVNNSEK